MESRKGMEEKQKISFLDSKNLQKLLIMVVKNFLTSMFKFEKGSHRSSSTFLEQILLAQKHQYHWNDTVTNEE